jgi:hypothetical protein
MRKAAFPFVAIAIAFIAIGISGQRTFIYVGAVFLVVAILGLVRNLAKSLAN